jgi:hypothetical protein
VCLECIRSWRQKDGQQTAKACPICRVLTRFIVPSNVWVEDPEMKMAVVEEYKKKLWFEVILIF